MGDFLCLSACFLLIVGAIAFKVWLMIKHPEVDARWEAQHQRRRQEKQRMIGKAVKWGVGRWL